MTAPVPNGRVLIVEDDADTVRSLSLLLGISGFEPRPLFANETVLPVVEDFRPRAVVLDLAMPGPDGFEIAAQLMALPHRPAVVVCSGWDGPELRERLERVGVDLYLTRPADPSALVAWLTAACGRAAAG